jgi:hypothetical protein
MGSGARWWWMAGGQLDSKGRLIGDTTRVDDKDGTSMTGMLVRLTMEATKANTASRH